MHSFILLNAPFNLEFIKFTTLMHGHLPEVQVFLPLKALFFYIKPFELILNSRFSGFLIFLTCIHVDVNIQHITASLTILPIKSTGSA
jgi:hypothetical protein